MMIQLQTALFTALTSAGLTVYSRVPDNAATPYAVIGDFTKNEWDTDGLTGFDATATVHTWSLNTQQPEIHTLMNAVYSALHRADLAVTGLMGIDFISDDLIRDPDGLHMHGIQRFRAKLRNET